MNYRNVSFLIYCMGIDASLVNFKIRPILSSAHYPILDSASLLLDTLTSLTPVIIPYAFNERCMSQLLNNVRKIRSIFYLLLRTMTTTTKALQSITTLLFVYFLKYFYLSIAAYFLVYFVLSCGSQFDRHCVFAITHTYR